MNLNTNMDMAKQVTRILSDAKDNGIMAKGYLEVVRSIQQKKAKLVIIAENIDNQKLVLEIKRLCNKHEIPVLSNLNKRDLGKSVGLNIDCGFASIKISGLDKKGFQYLIQLVAKA